MELKVSNYKEYKEVLDNQLKETAEGFVRIGYLLKLARDTDILAGSGYTNVNEFAKAEYNMDKSMVSRFININTRFAENGCSEYLKEQYRGFGYAKLVLMLQLPETVNEELSQDFTKSEIQIIKEEIDAEHKISDIEVLLEGQKEAQKELDSSLQKALHQLCEDEPALFAELYDGLKGADLEEIKDIMLCPGDTKIYSIRLPGIGRVMLSMKRDEPEIACIRVRENVKETYPWEEVFGCLEQLIRPDGMTSAQAAWESMYQKEFPKKEEVAPVQPNEQKKNGKKESKVTKAKVHAKEKKHEARKENAEKSETVQEDHAAENEVVAAEPAGKAKQGRETVCEAENKAHEESVVQNIPVEEGFVGRAPEEEQTPEPAELRNTDGMKEAPAVETESPAEWQQDVAVEIDFTFKERIQTAEWILEAVKRDQKAEARMYCHDLLRLLGEVEEG